MAFVSSCSGIVIVDSRTNSGKIILPAASTLAGRSIIFKDGYNSFANNSLTLSTTGIDTFENDTKSLTVNTNNGFVQLISGSNKWYTVGTSVAGSGIQSLDLVSTVSGLGSSGYLSSIGSIKVSTIQLTYSDTIFIGYSTSLQGINGLAYGNGIWVAAGSNSGARYSLQSSSNGFDWTDRIAADSGYPVMQTVRFLNSTFFAGAVGNGGVPNNSTILTSVDGSNWIIGTTPSASIYDFGYNSSFYLACGTAISTIEGGPADYSLFKSYDSLNWTQEQSTNIVTGKGLTYASSIWVMVGSNINNTGIETSLNGLNWTVIADSNIYIPNIPNVNNSTFIYTAYEGNKVAYNSSIWVTAGKLALSTIDIEDPNPLYDFPVLVSYDANSWFVPSSLLTSPNVNNIGTSVLWSGSNWIVGLSIIGNDSQFSSIITSPDGLDWTYQITGQAGMVTSIAKSDSLYIAGMQVFSNASLEYSLNGLDWVSNFSTSSIFSSIITSQCNALVINGNIFSYNDVSLTSSFSGIENSVSNLDQALVSSIVAVDQALVNSASTSISAIPKYITENFCIAGGVYTSVSYDGFNWTTLSNITTLTSINAIAWNGSYWIAVGDGSNTIALSSDGLNWIPASTNALNVEAKGVAWNGSYWVAAGSGSGPVTMAVSVDGFNWLAASNSLFIGGNSDTGLDVAWNGTHWIAVGISTGNSNTIILSSDGYNWSTVFQRTAIGYYANSVAWNGSYWLATAIDDAGSNPMLRSYDSYNWSYLQSNPFGYPSIGYKVAWNGISWLALGRRNGTTPVVSVSTDGTNWSTTSNCPVVGGDVTWNGSYWIVTQQGASSNGSNIALTKNGSNWISSSNNPFLNYTINTIASRRILPYVGLNITDNINDLELKSTVVSVETHINSSIIGLGSSGYLSTISIVQTENFCVAGTTGPSTSIIVSQDGYNWKTASNNLFTSVQDIAWNGAYWLASGIDPNNSTIILSADGYNWQYSSNNPANTPNGLAWNGSYWVAGSIYSINISYDGYNWLAASNNDLFSGTTVFSIAWNGSYWLAGVQGYSYSIAVSLDGYNWQSSINNPFNNGSNQTTANSIAWNGSYWVAVGNGSNQTIAISSDGYNWQNSSNNPFGNNASGFDIAWNGLYWISIGNGVSGQNLARSRDGYNWDLLLSNMFLDGNPNKITWNGLHWIVCGTGTGSPIIVSGDGYTWTGISSVMNLTCNVASVTNRRVLPYVGTQIIPNALTTLYNPLYPSIWASPQPSTIQSAIDRLAVLLSTFTTSNIP